MDAILERPNFECLLFGVFPALKNPDKFVVAFISSSCGTIK
jgi:hypothetical protein